jgi:uncharacterized damage-inducible protein DinB
MDLKKMMLDEIALEMANTRRVLERVPEDRMDWQPHAKSMSLSRLSSHLAYLPGLAVKWLSQDHADLPAAGAPRPAPLALKERAAILELFDANVRDLRAMAESWSEADLAATWTFTRGGQVLLTAPRLTALRRFLLSHSIHHRGQLTVYLRENDVPLPPIYGPTADEDI